MNVNPHHLSQNEANSGTGVISGTTESSSTQIVRPILTRGPLTVSSPVSGSPTGNGRVLPVVYVKMQQREVGSKTMLPVVSRSGNIISTISPKISTAPSGTPSSLTNQSGFVTIQGPIRSVSQTSSSQASQPHIITLPKVANTTLALSNQQLIALQSVSNQGGSVQPQQYVTIQAPIVSKTQQSSGGVGLSQVQPQYVTIRTPVLNPAASGTNAVSQSQFVTIQAPVVQTGLQSSPSPNATFLPVSSVGQTSASGKSPVTYQVLKSSVKAGEQHVMYPVSVSNLMPTSQQKMIFTPVTMMPKITGVSAGTTSITVQSNSDSVVNSGSISGIKVNNSPHFSTKILNNSTVSLLQAKSLQTISVRKEAVGLCSNDGSTTGVNPSKVNNVLLPMGVSVPNPSTSQGFINLTISNGHIQPASSKGILESLRGDSESKLNKESNSPSEREGARTSEPTSTIKETTGSPSSVELSGIDSSILSMDEFGKQKSIGEGNVIDLKSILSGGPNSGDELNLSPKTSNLDAGKMQSEIPENTSNSNATLNEGTAGLSEGPSSPINLFCEEGEITLSPPNDQPPPKYTITMNSDDDIKIVKNDRLTSEKDSGSSQAPFKPLLKKTSPKLLSKGSASAKGQSLLRNPAALNKPANSKIGVKSILKPQTNKKLDIKTEVLDYGTENMDGMHSPGDSKDSLDAPISPLTPTSFEDFDAVAALEWKNGVGLLPGSNLKFRMNEFGLMEMVSDDDDKSIKGIKDTNSDSEGLLIDEGSNSSIEVKPNFDTSKDKKDSALDDVYCCETCNVYGLASEFLNDRFCTQACSAAFAVKKAWQYRREQDLRALRLRRKKRRLEQQREAREKAEQDMKEEDVKSGIAPMQKVLKKLRTSAVESMSDGDDSMEDPMSADFLAPLSPSPSFIDKASSSHQMMNMLERDEEIGRKGSKHKSSANFTWSKYLEMVKAKAAPSKLFKDPYPYLKNGFKVGMKLEGIDPDHPACFCVLTIAEVRGYRIRLHFDGYPENYDFWVNADSPEIFQAGWCEKNLRRLTPPKGHTSFNWNSYLKLCKATAAPKYLFSKSSASPVCPNGFRVGMKLEAVDRKNSSLICVASIADIVDGRCLIHFDSWDDMYDYWADPSSPYIHPVGWCEAHGIVLTPPNQYKDPTMFSWEKYLKETKTSPAPSRAFKQKQPTGFRCGMRIEAVDKRVPHLIRVATVDDVHEHQIRVRFDGWPDEFSYWTDDDSPDIHPPGWCFETKHPLEPPLSDEDMKILAKCGVPGCKGEGHIKGPRYTTHTSAQNCPYSPENLHKDSYLPDRLTSSNDHAALHESPSSLLSDKIDTGKSIKRPHKWKRLLEDSDDSDPKRFRSRLSEDDDDFGEKPSLLASMQQKLQSELERSVVDPGYQVETGPGRPPLWIKHSQPLHESPAIRDAVNPRSWSIQEVMDFLSSISCLKEYCKVFKEQDIDGEALLMLTQNELVSNMNLKLGHAIRLYNCIVILRQRCA